MALTHKFHTLLALALITLTISSTAYAQVEVTGSLDIVGKKYQSKTDYSNNTFAGQNTFSTSRARLFFDSKVSDNTTVFVQIFSDGGRYLAIYAAYLRLEKLFGTSLNLQAGRIPNTIGTWGTRTYAGKNPLIGVPLVWNHHSSLSPKDLGVTPTIQDLLDLREHRPYGGLPVLYDFCWNSGAELYGSVGMFDFSVAALAGSVSSPLNEQGKKLPQGTARLSCALSPGFIIGASGFYGTYLNDAGTPYQLPDGTESTEYMNMGGGGDLYLAHGPIELYSEAYYTSWEYPNLPLLAIVAGYVEAKYKFTPGWYAAGRFDIYEPRKISWNQTDVAWDYEIKRYEFGLGYKPIRNLTVKAVSQLNRFTDAPQFNIDHLAVQMALEFH